jgi:hypothetical protein
VRRHWWKWLAGLLLMTLPFHVAIHSCASRVGEALFESHRQAQQNEQLTRQLMITSCSDFRRNRRPLWGLPDTPEGLSKMEAICAQ